MSAAAINAPKPHPLGEIKRGFRRNQDERIYRPDRIDGVLPEKGVVVVYGLSQAFKSFSVLDMVAHSVFGEPWAGRRVTKSRVLYIAAEGGGGMDARLDAIADAHPEWPDSDGIAMLSSSPNLGSTTGDAQGLIDLIDQSGVRPEIIVLDTLSQMLHGAEENTTGAAAFLTNALRLSKVFDALVIIVHHKGWSKQRRPRGFSGLYDNPDGLIVCERTGDLTTSLTVEKMRDGPEGDRFTLTMREVTIGRNAYGKDVKTLVVDRIEAGMAPSKPEGACKVSKNVRKLMAAMLDDPDASQAEWAETCRASRGSINNWLNEAKANQLAYNVSGKWSVSLRGQEALTCQRSTVH